MREPDSGTAQPRREAEVSRQRQEHAREQVIRPLERYAERNQFANLIRASLVQGPGRRQT